MNFLELTSYIGEPDGYADSPDFQSDIWPLMRRKAQEIESVFLFRSDKSSSMGWLGHYDLVSQNIIRIGSMSDLNDTELSRIEHWSFYGGHLSVVYRVSIQSSLVHEFCKLFPGVSLSSDDIDQLAMEPELLSELRWLSDESPKEILHFAFAHDADPLFIFGDLDVLRSLLVVHYSS